MQREQDALPPPAAVACRNGDAPPDEVIGDIWPYLVALLVSVVIIAVVPWISTVTL